MKTKTAIQLSGGRDRLAILLGVETITTYHWKRVLPPKHERYLRAMKPEWFDAQWLTKELLPSPPPPESEDKTLAQASVS